MLLVKASLNLFMIQPAYKTHQFDIQEDCEWDAAGRCRAQPAAAGGSQPQSVSGGGRGHRGGGGRRRRYNHQMATRNLQREMAPGDSGSLRSTNSNSTSRATHRKRRSRRAKKSTSGEVDTHKEVSNSWRRETNSRIERSFVISNTSGAGAKPPLQGSYASVVSIGLPPFKRISYEQASNSENRIPKPQEANRDPSEEQRDSTVTSTSTEENEVQSVESLDLSQLSSSHSGSRTIYIADESQPLSDCTIHSSVESLLEDTVSCTEDTLVSEDTDQHLEDDCSFMTYSSDGISVIIRGLEPDDAGVADTVTVTVTGEERSECCDNADDASSVVEMPVSSPSSIWPEHGCSTPRPRNSPNGDCWADVSRSLDNTGGGSNSTSSTNSICYSRSACSSDDLPLPTSPQADGGGPVINAFSPPPPTISINTFKQLPGDWMWLPSLLPECTVLMRWVWFPSPPSNLPGSKDNNNENPVRVKYMLRGIAPTCGDITFVEGDWKNCGLFWQWIPRKQDLSQRCRIYDLPVTPQPAVGAWYLVWPAELRMTVSPIADNTGTWISSPFPCAHDILLSCIRESSLTDT